mgnify:CR=1 FL=1
MPGTAAVSTVPPSVNVTWKTPKDQLQLGKFFNPKLSLFDQFPEEPDSQLMVLGDRERVRVIWLHHHDVGADLSINSPTGPPELLDRFSA